MKSLNKTMKSTTIVALFASALWVAPASATSSSGFSRVGLANGQFGTLNVNTESDKTGKWGMLLRTKDDSDVGTDELTVLPGGYSGWHAHPAAVFVTVTEGSIVWYDGSNPLCTPHTYTAPASFIENAYGIHNVRNTGTVTAKFVAIRINPTGVPFRLDRTTPNNC
ncbi:cupin domain-containing protein [Sphingomonas sp.]|uniref:cupin domain-containing protein n=1 Tax=Sphingomonas sp. TaxID=28214 RepID=UPI00325FD174